MNFRVRPKEEIEINLAPLIDAVFLLLIFFMVTTTFNYHAELRVDLPEASAEPDTQQQRPLELVIDAQNRYYLNGHALVNTQPATLRAALQEMMAESEQPARDMAMIIRADGRSSHQAVITVMDSAARVGLTRLSIATTTSE